MCFEACLHDDDSRTSSNDFSSDSLECAYIHVHNESACRFKLKALAGHSKAGQKVTYGAIKGAKFKQLALVPAPCFCLAVPSCA